MLMKVGTKKRKNTMYILDILLADHTDKRLIINDSNLVLKILAYWHNRVDVVSAKLSIGMWPKVTANE